MYGELVVDKTEKVAISSILEAQESCSKPWLIDFLQRHRHEAENIEFDEWCDVRAEQIKQEAKKGRRQK